MKILFHLLAAFCGLLLAAVIVFLVFGNASEQATQVGENSETINTSGRSLCGSVPTDKLADQKTLEQAEKNLPVIKNSAGESVSPAANQRLWFAKVFAASGLCATEIQMSANIVNIKIDIAKDSEANTATAYTYRSLAASFTSPLDRNRSRVTTTVQGETKTILISQNAWNTFQRRAVSLGLGKNLNGLIEFRRTTAYPRSEFTISNW